MVQRKISGFGHSTEVLTGAQAKGVINILFTHSSLSNYCKEKSIKVISGGKLMPTRLIAVCPETRTRHVNALYEQKVELFNVYSRGSKCNHGAKDEVTYFQSVLGYMPRLSRVPK